MFCSSFQLSENISRFSSSFLSIFLTPHAATSLLPEMLIRQALCQIQFRSCATAMPPDKISSGRLRLLHAVSALLLPPPPRFFASPESAVQRQRAVRYFRATLMMRRGAAACAAAISPFAPPRPRRRRMRRYASAAAIRFRRHAIRFRFHTLFYCYFRCQSASALLFADIDDELQHY